MLPRITADPIATGVAVACMVAVAIIYLVRSRGGRA
jgi:hypothetical protein